MSTGKSTGISTWFMFGVEPTIAHPNGYLETMDEHEQARTHTTGKLCPIHHGYRGFVAGPSIAHLETQYSWAQARTLPHSKGSRPTGMEAPPMLVAIIKTAISYAVQELKCRIGELKVRTRT